MLCRQNAKRVVACNSPADEDLKCVYCGKSAELDKTAAEIEENDFNYWKDRQ